MVPVANLPIGVAGLGWCDRSPRQGSKSTMLYRAKLTAISGIIVFAVVASVPQQVARAAGPVVLAQAAAADSELAPEQRAQLKAEIARVPSDLKGRFDVRYRAWMYSWLRKPLIFSNAKSARPSPEFRALISLGPDILPLLVGKLANRDETRALQVYDALQERAELRVDPQAYPDERQRALETVRRWLART